MHVAQRREAGSKMPEQPHSPSWSPDYQAPKTQTSLSGSKPPSAPLIGLEDQDDWEDLKDRLERLTRRQRLALSLWLRRSRG